jgi:hypothetical protein
MDKEHILREIWRTAKENGGVPLGKLRFSNETGIKEQEFLGKYWARWNDAITEAGFSPNKLQGSIDESVLLDKYISLARQLGRLPVPAELRLQTRKDPDFPHERTYGTRFGSKSAIVERLVQYCQGRPDYEDILGFCHSYNPQKEKTSTESGLSEMRVGFVYLFKHGSRREYKIGKTFNPIRREGEIALQLPEKLEPIHHIKTDDPSGIEQYWHSRFAKKRLEGEWFALDAADIRAFKKWRAIY